MTLKKAAQEFGVSSFTISYWLKKLGYSYKKKPSPIWKQAKKSQINIENRPKIQNIQVLYIQMKAGQIWVFAKIEDSAKRAENIIKEQILLLGQ